MRAIVEKKQTNKITKSNKNQNEEQKITDERNSKAINK